MTQYLGMTVPQTKSSDKRFFLVNCITFHAVLLLDFLLITNICFSSFVLRIVCRREVVNLFIVRAGVKIKFSPRSWTSRSRCPSFFSFSFFVLPPKLIEVF